jgi:hypothetical protein
MGISFITDISTWTGKLYKLQQNQTCVEFLFRCNNNFSYKGSFNKSRTATGMCIEMQNRWRRYATGMCIEMQNRWRRYQDFGGDPALRLKSHSIVF